MATAKKQAKKPAAEKQSTGIKGRGGKRAGAGRKKGVPNKRTAQVQAAVEATGITPLEFMLQIMRNEPIYEDPKLQFEATAMRFEAAKAAAPYVHAKLSSIDLKADISTHEAALEDLA